MFRQSSGERSPFFVSKRDLVARLKYGDGMKIMYVGAVALGAMLLISALLGDSATLQSTWFLAGEALLTASYALEVVAHMWLSGPAQYLRQSYANAAEFGLCMACCTMFGFSLWQKYARLEIEAVLVSLRYSAQLARLYFFMRQHQSAGRGSQKVAIHEHDNPAVSLSHDTYKTQPRPAWCQDDTVEDEFIV
eukprot:TRINITY_DN11299_c0_g1_i2.p1 TRINITY_DN11299_c0_g1~~TRINITY_DN11299_c0_g1_i2.p1  ORF type:complete len:192 (+),score=41.37 TRINITY_DN11299_c0_g1_i2:54-629(+)